MNICAAPDCDNPLPHRPGQPGRPPIYCSPRCRPSHTGHSLTIEIHNNDPLGEAGRDWHVQLRRGTRTVAIAHNLGRFSATALADDLQTLLHAPIDTTETTP